MAMASPIGTSTCHFLNLLPAELRNHIYELALVPPACVKLNDAVPPSMAVLLTCKKIYVEVKEMWRVAHLSFWADTHFRVTLYTCAGQGSRASDSNKECFLYAEDEANADKIARIRFLTIQRIGDEDRTFTEGKWTQIAPTGDATQFIAVEEEDALVLSTGGYEAMSLASSNGWFAVKLPSTLPGRSKKADEIAGKTRMTGEELAVVIRYVAHCGQCF